MRASSFLEQQFRKAGIDLTGRAVTARDSSVRSRWLKASFLSMLLMGCEGRATTDTLPWSCNESCSGCPTTPEPPALVGFWRFDEAIVDGQWQGTDGSTLSWSQCDSQSGEWVATGAWSTACGTERLSGLGGSLRLAGNGYLQAALAEKLKQPSLTLAAWVSLHRLARARTSVVSVVRPLCQSVWLDLDMSGSRRKLILSAEKPVANSDECEVEERSTHLPSGFFDWGMGSWYHVAAALDGNDEPSLFVDGSPGAVSEAEVHPGTPSTSPSVHIGADPAGEQPFAGLIDDVALFERSLGADEMEKFVAESASVRSDGQQWTAWSAAGSSASWKNDCNNPELEQTKLGMSVVVKNGYWSAGGVFARVKAGRRIRQLKKAVLVADIPDEQSFDFVLASKHNAERCTWHASGRGKQRYEFSLGELNHCDCPSTCDCTFAIEEARIGSRWDENDAFEFSVCRVEFEWEEVDSSGAIALEQGPGGMQGLNDWCWRPISYHEHALVDLDEKLTGESRTVATVQGGNRQTAYLAADFAEGKPGEAHQLCNLSQVEKITLHADMPDGYAYQLRVADFHGIGREWSRQWEQAEQTQEFVICDPESSLADEGVCGRDADPIPHGGRPVDLEQVRYLGIQKSFELTSTEGVISIDKVEFTGPAQGSCSVATSSGGAGPE